VSDSVIVFTLKAALSPDKLAITQDRFSKQRRPAGSSLP
jgi:hypothetical protein